METKLYIVTLKYEDMFKRIYLEGDASPSGEEIYKRVADNIPNIGESSSSFKDFIQSVILEFSNNGFTQIRG